MKKVEALAYLIIASLLLTAIIRIQVKETVDDDMKMMRTAKPKPDSANRFLLATWNKAGRDFNDNMRKVPSAPNPSGNRHPPAKP